MEPYRSRSNVAGRTQTQMEPYGMEDLRSHSTPHAYTQQHRKVVKFKRGRSVSSAASSSSCSASRGGGGWGFSDPETQRRKRVAGYNVYAVEGKVKGSLRRSFRWVKERFSHAVHGWW